MATTLGLNRPSIPPPPGSPVGSKDGHCCRGGQSGGTLFSMLLLLVVALTGTSPLSFNPSKKIDPINLFTKKNEIKLAMRH